MLQYSGHKNGTGAIYSYRKKVWAKRFASQAEAERGAEAFLTKLEAGDVDALEQVREWCVEHRIEALFGKVSIGKFTIDLATGEITNWSAK